MGIEIVCIWYQLVVVMGVHQRYILGTEGFFVTKREDKKLLQKKKEDSLVGKERTFNLEEDSKFKRRSVILRPR